MFRKEKNSERVLDETEVEPEQLQKADLRAAQHQQIAPAREQRAIQQERRATRIIREVKVDEEVTWQPEFSEVKAPCFLVDMQFSRSGDVIFKIRVPYRWRQLVMGLSEAYNTPLEAHITKWSKADNERSRLAELYRNRQKGSSDPYELGSDGTADDGSDGASTISSDDDVC